MLRTVRGRSRSLKTGDEVKLGRFTFKIKRLILTPDDCDQHTDLNITNPAPAYALGLTSEGPVPIALAPGPGPSPTGSVRPIPTGPVTTASFPTVPGVAVESQPRTAVARVLVDPPVKGVRRAASWNTICSTEYTQSNATEHTQSHTAEHTQPYVADLYTQSHAHSHTDLHRHISLERQSHTDAYTHAHRGSAGLRSAEARLLSHPGRVRSEDYTQGGSDATCRICLSDEETSTDPLISPCACSGSLRWVHLNCLRTWMHGRLSAKPENGAHGATCFYWRPLECELCKQVCS